MRAILIYMFFLTVLESQAQAIKFVAAEEMGLSIFAVQIKDNEGSIVFRQNYQLHEDETKTILLKPHLVIGGSLDIFIPGRYGKRELDCFSINPITANTIQHIDDKNNIVKLQSKDHLEDFECIHK